MLPAMDDSKVNKKPESGAASAYTETISFEIDGENWQDIVYHFRYAPDASGFFQLWINGKLIFHDKGPNVYI